MQQQEHQWLAFLFSSSPFLFPPHVFVVLTISCCLLLLTLPISVCCRMPASGTMVAPFGRVMSGRGFAPGSFQPHDIPAAGQFTKDLPNVGNKPNIDVWLQQAKMANSMQLFGKGFLNNSMRPVVRGEPRLLELQVRAALLSRCCTVYLAFLKCTSFMGLAVLKCHSFMDFAVLRCLCFFGLVCAVCLCCSLAAKHACTLVNYFICHVWQCTMNMPTVTKVILSWQGQIKLQEQMCIQELD